MPRKAAQQVETSPAALGFRVKSGRAIAVLLAVSDDGPQVLDCREIDLCDPQIPTSRQPYHAKMSTLQTDEVVIQRLRQVVFKASHRSIASLLENYRDAGYSPCAAGLVVGSETDPEKITNSHIRAHAFEGRLFREAVEEALVNSGVKCLVFLERSIYAEGAKTFGRPEEDLKVTLSGLSRGAYKPWRSDEKTSTLAAWLALHHHNEPHFILTQTANN